MNLTKILLLKKKCIWIDGQDNDEEGEGMNPVRPLKGSNLWDYAICDKANIIDLVD